jgi:YesN/AraC family two-component response regulator
VPKTLSIVWISCSAGNSATELLQECQRACVVSTCLPSRALSTIAAGPTTVVIFDYGDPAAADLHLLQSVKRQHPSLPILMLTDTHSADLAVWAMRARVWNYLVKPVPLRELKTNLQRLANLSSPRELRDREMLRPATTRPIAYSDADPHGDDSVLQRIVEDIRRDCSTGLSVAQLARSSGMSRFSFSRLFHRNFGISYRDFMTRQRLEKACKMLELPGSSVTGAARAAGFSDASYFARVFRRHMRKSPKEYAQAATRSQDYRLENPGAKDI